MDAISRVKPLVDALEPREKQNRLNDPIVQAFLDYIDRSVAESRERRKIETEAKLEARRLQAEFEKELAYLQGRVESARQAMMGAPNLPGIVSSEEKAYFYWVSQLESFKQEGRILSV